jgi:thioredoxin reductase (NADPH)
MVDALERRFDRDYRIAASSAADLDGELLNNDPVAVALAPMAAEHLDGLRAVSVAHPTARRIAIVDVGDTSVHDELTRAITLGQVDYYVGQPWGSPDEELYPVLSEALRVWAHAQRLRLTKATLVHEPGDELGSQLASMMERNGIPAQVHAPTSPAGADLLEGPLAGVPLPAVLLWDDRALGAPAVVDLAAALGGNTRPTRASYDVAIVGAGPAGLAAATYAASEGLTSVAVEGVAVGGQAATSAKIRNYLGFPWGIRGSDLGAQAAQQAAQLGAELIVVRQVTTLRADGDDRVLTLSSGDEVRARAVILAGGVTYRRTGVDAVDALIGHGVFYGAAAGEAQAMTGLRVAILGGGNSAGQAAAHLAAAGADVTVLIRGDSLGKSMSDYLVQQLDGTPNVTVRTRVQLSGARGEGQLQGLEVQHAVDGVVELEVDALFVFIGARPHTDWLDGTVELDDHGYVVTGADGAAWLETSMPGVFAAGDIRAGSIKRVAAAVGEGSTASMLARGHLAALDA